jgi:SAM-dependent methyltransferase
MNRFLDGEVLYGEDLSPAELIQWYADEEQGYYNLTTTDSPYSYGYHALNQRLFRHLPKRFYKEALGVGSARGDELLPLEESCASVTLLEPGNFTPALTKPKVRYVKPTEMGTFPFPDNTFDLIACLSVLHHIPKVSVAVREIYRVCSNCGYVVLREPTHSMGDWSKPRRGLTQHERGIPEPILRRFILEAGFSIVHHFKCCFSLTSRLLPLAPKGVFNSKWMVGLDAALCQVPIWPDRYHSSRWWHKLRPVQTAFVLRKD